MWGLRYLEIIMENLSQEFQKYEFKPAKWMGQNFLADKDALQKMIDTSNIKKNDIIIEIGPGFGILTLELAKKAKKVIAIEKDKKLAEILSEILKENEIKNTAIIQEDALKFSPAEHNLANFKYKIVANIPYYITAPLIRKFLENELKPEIMILMTQKEVAQRIIAKPPEMSILAVATQFYSNPEIIAYISKNSFKPIPKVDSAILKMTIKKPDKMPNIDPKIFFAVVKAGFSGKRKQLVNTLSNGLNLNKNTASQILKENEIEPKRRAESLSLEEWLKLAKNLND